jgi:hypothetical protein
MNGADQVWVSTGIILVLLALIAHPAIHSTIKWRRGEPDNRFWLKKGQTIIWWVLLVSILIRTIVGLSLLAAGKNHLNGHDVSGRFMFAFQAAAIVFAWSIIAFNVIGKKLCRGANKMYCARSLTLFVVGLVLIVPIFLTLIYLPLKGGSELFTRDELIRSTRMTYVAIYVNLDNEDRQKQAQFIGLDLTENTILKLVYDEGADLGGIVYKHNPTGDIYIAFRGSAGLSNWAKNFTVTSFSFDKPYLGSAVRTRITDEDIRGHEGFIEAYDVLQPLVNDSLNVDFYLKQAYTDAPKIWITGHSLGGAISQVAGLHMISVASIYGKSAADIHIVPLSAPAVGDANFVALMDDLEAKICRVVVPWDPVPLVTEGLLPHVGGLKQVLPPNPWDALVASHSHGSLINGLKADGQFWIYFFALMVASVVLVVASLVIVWGIGKGYDWVRGRKVASNTSKVTPLPTNAI